MYSDASWKPANSAVSKCTIITTLWSHTKGVSVCMQCNSSTHSSSIGSQQNSVKLHTGAGCLSLQTAKYVPRSVGTTVSRSRPASFHLHSWACTYARGFRILQITLAHECRLFEIFAAALAFLFLSTRAS
jgi:hypothetical protein